ncbi:MAG: alternative ribosome rescue aminoacyl-tRNA hydrolase ArfB [Phycisphaerae bacterium]
MLRINRRIFIDDADIECSYSRSSGPGGQNVNKLNTKVTISLDLTRCQGLNDSDKKQLLKKLSSRINKDGKIRVTCQKYRTQKANRQKAVEKLSELLRDAIKTNQIRRKTKAPRWAKEKRLEEKKKHSKIKQERAKSSFEY